MKKNHFFTFVGALAIALGVASCTSDDENHCHNQVEPKIKTTKSVRKMTKKEVEARIDELEKEYGVSIFIKDTARMTESIFEEMELEMMTNPLVLQKKAENNGI